MPTKPPSAKLGRAAAAARKNTVKTAMDKPKRKPPAPATKDGEQPKRKPDAPALKAQKAAATREAMAVIKSFSNLSASAIEEKLGIGRPKQSKKDGKSGDLVNRFRRAGSTATAKQNSTKASKAVSPARDVTLGYIMFEAVKCGLLDPQRYVEMCAQPGIRRAILPVSRLLLRLAIRGERTATNAEAKEGYGEWCKAVEEHNTKRSNERARFTNWKLTAQGGLSELIERLDTMQHHSWSPTDPECLKVIVVDGSTVISPRMAFLQSAYRLMSMIETIEQDAMYEIDGDLPGLELSDAEKAEVLRQQGRYIDRPAISDQEALIWDEALKAEQMAIDARQPEEMYRIHGDLPGYRNSVRQPDEANFGPKKESVRPVLTFAEAQAWAASINANPNNELGVLIHPEMVATDLPQSEGKAEQPQADPHKPSSLVE